MTGHPSQRSDASGTIGGIAIPTQFDDAYARLVTAELEARGIAIGPGFRGPEFEAIELAVGSPIPPELRRLWEAGVPTGKDFPSWRNDPIGEAKHFRDWIAGAVRFDVEKGQYWHPSWGPRPTEDQTAVARALEILSGAPPMIRVFSHRFMTTEPHGWGNPVLSVWQMVDSVYYGFDLADYLAKEFEVTRPDWAASAPPFVPFWGQLFGLESPTGSGQ